MLMHKHANEIILIHVKRGVRLCAVCGVLCAAL
jgi:hypothetical protein